MGTKKSKRPPRARVKWGGRLPEGRMVEASAAERPNATPNTTSNASAGSPAPTPDAQSANPAVTDNDEQHAGANQCGIAPGELPVLAAADSQGPIEVPVDRFKIAAPFSALMGREDRAFGLIVSDMKKSSYNRAFPAVVWIEQGVVVDGVQRVEAAQVAGLKTIWVILRSFKDEAEAVSFAIHCQRARRNLTDAQLMKLLPHIDKPGKRGGDRKSAVAKIKPSDDGLPTSAARTAAALGVSATTVERSRAIMKDPELDAQVQAGSLGINAAHEQLRAKQRGAAAKVLQAYRSGLRYFTKASKLLGPHDAELVQRMEPLIATIRVRIEELEESALQGGRRART